MDMKSVEILSETMASLHNIVEQLDSSVYAGEPKNFEQQPFCSTPNDGETIFFPSSPSILSPAGKTLSPVSSFNQRERQMDGCVERDLNMVSLASEQNFRIRQGSNAATATQVDTYSYTKGGDLCEKDNYSFDRQQTLSFDVPKKQRGGSLSVENIIPSKSPNFLQDSNEKASRMKELASGNSDIDYLLDVGHWDLNEPEPLNPTLLLGSLYNVNKDREDDAGPDYEPEERDALNWLKRKRLEFGHFAHLLNEM